jgi:hypothetical protein
MYLFNGYGSPSVSKAGCECSCKLRVACGLQTVAANRPGRDPAVRPSPKETSPKIARFILQSQPLARQIISAAPAEARICANASFPVLN